MNKIGETPQPNFIKIALILIFRMDMNMLMDLDKEYLRDLKITALGDIISILKHAKVQHER